MNKAKKLFNNLLEFGSRAVFVVPSTTDNLVVKTLKCAALLHALKASFGSETETPPKEE